MNRNNVHISIFVLLIYVLFHIDVLSQTNERPVVIGKSIEFNSKILNEKRSIQIYLPESYQNNLYSYPVFYVLDGEDNFINAASIVKNQSSYYQHMPEMIVVAISSANRNKIFSIVDGGADKTLNFIKDELIPYVDSIYRTEKFRILFGHSIAGPFCFYALSKYNYLFDAFIILSPTMHNKICQPATKTLEDCFNSHKELNKVVYVGVAEGDNAKHQESFKMVKSLFTAKAPKAIEYKFETLSGEDHFTEATLGIYEGLNLIYKPWRIPKEVIEDADVPKLKIHIDSLSAKYGYKVKYPEFLLTFIGMEFVDPEAQHPVSKETMVNAAKEIFEMNVENYPNSSKAYSDLGTFYMFHNNKELAIKNLGKALELNPENEKAKGMLTKIKGK
jgi:predicted alpha/beta superfamily hydrolase